jgi:hypothetical protein
LPIISIIKLLKTPHKDKTHHSTFKGYQSILDQKKSYLRGQTLRGHSNKKGVDDAYQPSDTCRCVFGYGHDDLDYRRPTYMTRCLCPPFARHLDYTTGPHHRFSSGTPQARRPIKA